MDLLSVGEIRVGLEAVEPGVRADRHQREMAAVGRVLTAILGDGEWTIGHHDDGAPYLVGLPGLYISISHSTTQVAVALSGSPMVGIDTETLRGQLERVLDKYLTPGEQELFNTPALHLQAWCIKEAAYKAVRRQGLPLHDIVIDPVGHRVTIASGHRETLSYTELPSPAGTATILVHDSPLQP